MQMPTRVQLGPGLTEAITSLLGRHPTEAEQQRFLNTSTPQEQTLHQNRLIATVNLRYSFTCQVCSNGGGRNAGRMVEIDQHDIWQHLDSRRHKRKTKESSEMKDVDADADADAVDGAEMKDADADANAVDDAGAGVDDDGTNL